MLEKDKTSLDKYLEDIGKEELLTEAEERELSERIKRGDRRAVEKLTTANLRFVVAMARQYKNKGVDMQDLVSEGNIGLMRAAERFDAGQGARFVSYAVPFVRKCMERAIDEQAGLCRVPNNNEGTTEKKRSRTLSADAPLGGRENVSLLHIIENPNAPQADAHVNSMVMTEELNRLLSVLNEREKEVLILFFGIGDDKLTFAEIGKRLGLKRERVRQIRDKAVRKISHGTDSEVLQSLLGQ